jgi:hypothetical protein
MASRAALVATALEKLPLSPVLPPYAPLPLPHEPPPPTPMAIPIPAPAMPPVVPKARAPTTAAHLLASLPKVELHVIMHDYMPEPNLKRNICCDHFGAHANLHTHVAQMFSRWALRLR